MLLWICSSEKYWIKSTQVCSPATPHLYVRLIRTPCDLDVLRFSSMKTHRKRLELSAQVLGFFTLCLITILYMEANKWGLFEAPYDKRHSRRQWGVIFSSICVIMFCSLSISKPHFPGKVRFILSSAELWLHWFKSWWLIYLWVIDPLAVFYPMTPKCSPLGTDLLISS